MRTRVPRVFIARTQEKQGEVVKDNNTATQAHQQEQSSLSLLQVTQGLQFKSP